MAGVFDRATLTPEEKVVFERMEAKQAASRAAKGEAPPARPAIPYNEPDRPDPMGPGQTLLREIDATRRQEHERGMAIERTRETSLPGCVKIGGTGRTATVRAVELAREYGTATPFEVVRRYAVADWYAVEQAAHRMLADRRRPAVRARP